jgi:hypothetical protein
MKGLLVDIGGVMISSPLAIIHKVEQEMDLPRNAISFQLGHSPFFEQLETGKLSLEEF